MICEVKMAHAKSRRKSYYMALGFRVLELLSWQLDLKPKTLRIRYYCFGLGALPPQSPKTLTLKREAEP